MNMNFVQVNRPSLSSRLLRLCATLLVAVFIFYVLYLGFYEAFPVGVTPMNEVCDVSMTPNRTNMEKSGYTVPLTPVTENKFTVLLLSNDRPHLLLKCLANYAQIGSVHKIIVIWSNTEVKPPDIHAKISFRMPVVVKTLEKNSLRLRFDAYDEVETEGVLTADDDLIVEKSDILLAFQVWRQHPYGLVGFHRRSHSGAELGSYRYQSWLELVLRGGYYSMILTGTSFLHRQYLHMYMNHLPVGVAETVDRFFNCEDIAMNFLVQNHCGCAGIFYVKNRYTIEHISESGLSKRTGHTSSRHDCINQFAKFYRTMPLQSVNCRY